MSHIFYGLLLMHILAQPERPFWINLNTIVDPEIQTVR